MRLSYVANPPQDQSADEEAITRRIEARRHPRPLQPLDLTLLHSPHVADGWNSFVGAVRTKTSIPDDLRELSICRIAAVNEAWYEWMHHCPLAIKAGIQEASMVKLLRKDPLTRDTRISEFTEKQWVALLVADEMTRNVRVVEVTFAMGCNFFTEKELVELVATVACYNCVSRFLVALDVGEKKWECPRGICIVSMLVSAI